MSLRPFQILSVRVFSALRRLLARAGSWVQERPRLAAWILPTDAEVADERYRDFNGRYFASFREQERMLADRPRMAFYQAAISRHVQPGDHVIDLGTGTGILAAMASRRGAAKVHAIDHSPILEHAREVAAANRLRNVEFVATHSREFHLDAPVDVIVHEQMGDCLFDESMVANVVDLRDRLLKPGGRILPGHFEFYCEPIMIRNERLVPFLWELKVHGYDYSCLERHRPQEPDYYHLCSTDPTVVDRFLGEPEPAMTIDLHTVTEAALPQELRFERTVVSAGRLDACAIYFKARVDHDLQLGTGPLEPGRAPHWGFRILRREGIEVAAGDVIEITLSAERWAEVDSWRWNLQKRTPRAGAALLTRP